MKRPDFPVLNPRYKGATPEDVARALLRKRRPPQRKANGSERRPTKAPVS
jgi:hypothetical protein